MSSDILSESNTQDAPELTLPEVDENVQISVCYDPFDDQYAHVFGAN